MTPVRFRVAARANWGRWIVDCPVCPSADALRPGTPVFECVECGTRVEVGWPSEAMRGGVERLLMMRPNPVTRNWEPGESLNDLLFENAAHGVFDGLGQAELDNGLVMAIEGDEIRVDGLPATPARKALVA